MPLQWRYAYVPPTRIAQVGHYLTNVFPFVNSCADSAHCGRGRFLFSHVWHLFPVTVLAVPDAFIGQGTQVELLKQLELDATGVAARIRRMLASPEALPAPPASQAASPA